MTSKVGLCGLQRLQTCLPLSLEAARDEPVVGVDGFSFPPDCHALFQSIALGEGSIALAPRNSWTDDARSARPEVARGGYLRRRRAARLTMERKATYWVMVSSTYAELVEHRRAVREAMPGQRLLAIAMEDDAALPDQDLINASLAKVDEADAYVGLISYRYGQMPKCPTRNPDRLSLTELEFHRAVARGIPVCMFIMHGDHPVPRRAVGEERGAKQKLRSFLNLAKKDRIYAEFKSVEDLKTKAVQSLGALREVLDRRASVSLSTSRAHDLDRPSGRALAQLVAAVGDAIEAFTDKVELIAGCKSIHDHLHEILENVVRPLHDEVLPLWRQEDRLQGETYEHYRSRMMALAVEEGALKGALEDPTSKLKGDQSDLSVAAEVVLQSAQSLHPKHVPIKIRTEFEDLFDRFSSEVNTAFGKADERMQREARVLHQLRDDLTRKVKDARRQRPLTPVEDDQLDEWIDQVAIMLKKLDDAIDTHHEWQEFHKCIEFVEAFRDTRSFSNKLSGFCAVYVDKLNRLITRELKASVAVGSGANGLQTLRDRLERLDASRIAERFDEFRRPFDQAFYCVDKRTLSEVEGARGNVQKFMKVRDDLLRAHPTASTTKIAIYSS